MKKTSAIKAINDEFNSAVQKFPEPFKSSHEAYAVLLEEVEELWHEIKNNKHPGSNVRQRDEAIQVGAMALKFLVQLC